MHDSFHDLVADGDYRHRWQRLSFRLSALLRRATWGNSPASVAVSAITSSVHPSRPHRRTTHATIGRGGGWWVGGGVDSTEKWASRCSRQPKTLDFARTWVKVVSSSMDERYVSEACTFEQPVRPSTTIAGRISWKKITPNTPSLS